MIILIAKDDQNTPLAGIRFTHAELGYIMPVDTERLQVTVNFMMDQMILKGEMTVLRKEYLHMTE